MYTLALVLHSLIRWAVLVTGLVAAFRALRGWLSRTEWTAADARAGMLFVASLDTQLLLGLVLYFVLSPLTRAAMGDMHTAMHYAPLRFWAVEHITMGILAVVAAHVARVTSKRATGIARHRRAAIGYVVAVLLVLAAIPWPMLAYGRPLLRLH